MAGQLKVNQLQLGDSITPTQNFVLQTNVDGTAKLARGNAGGTSQDILTVDASGKVKLPQGSGDLVYTPAVTPLPSAGVSYVASHGLSATPIDVTLEITCLNADSGYSVGDVVQVIFNWNSSVALASCAWKNSTQVGWPVASGVTICIPGKTTGGGGSPTPVNWSYRFKMRTA